jgi:hypothetical protein
MIPSRSALAAILLTSLFPLACHTRRSEMTEIQKSQALDAMKHLQAEFNTRNCELIYQEAGAHFRSQDPMDWRRECALLTEEMGPWRSFQVRDVQRWPRSEPAFCIFATADFQNQSKELAIVWTFSRKGAELFSIAVQRDEQHWKNIPAAPELNRGPWIDPPPTKTPGSVTL